MEPRKKKGKIEEEAGKAPIVNCTHDFTPTAAGVAALP
jgi:hypothetical protein